jgi:hypothetical protein
MKREPSCKIFLCNCLFLEPFSFEPIKTRICINKINRWIVSGILRVYCVHTYMIDLVSLI